jgi:hypothetical protein
MVIQSWYVSAAQHIIVDVTLKEIVENVDMKNFSSYSLPYVQVLRLYFINL